VLVGGGIPFFPPARAPGGSRTRRDPHLQLESRLPPLPRGALAGSRGGHRRRTSPDHPDSAPRRRSTSRHEEIRSTRPVRAVGAVKRRRGARSLLPALGQLARVVSDRNATPSWINAHDMCRHISSLPGCPAPAPAAPVAPRRRPPRPPAATPGM